MTEHKLKNTLALFLIVGHLGTILLVIVLRVQGGFLHEEMTTSIALLSPMFAVYATAVIAHLIDTRHSFTDTSKPVTGLFVFIAAMIPVLFVGSITTIILLKGYNIAFSDFEDFKQVLALIETVFAAYLGTVVRSLYKGSEQAQQAGAT